jgi:predicted lactoylglutathione lyase
MIGYVTLGSNDIEKAGAFYDALLAEVGGKRIMTNERMIMFGNGPGKPMVAVCTPYDEEEATVGNGTMVALSMDSQDDVQTLDAKAIELGAADEGAPDFRMPTFFGGYFRDLDGNKLVAFCMG